MAFFQTLLSISMSKMKSAMLYSVLDVEVKSCAKNLVSRSARKAPKRLDMKGLEGTAVKVFH